MSKNYQKLRKNLKVKMRNLLTLSRMNLLSKNNKDKKMLYNLNNSMNKKNKI